MKYWRKSFSLSILIVFTLMFSSCAQASDNDYTSRLYTPTYTTKISGIYFIVDCWNHRIIYSRDMTKPIKEWKTLDDDIAGPHSIAGDGITFVSEDSGRDRLIVYTLTSKGFKKTQVIDKIYGRPHKTIYDPTAKRFYVLTSTTQEIYTFELDNGQLSITNKVHLDF